MKETRVKPWKLYHLIALFCFEKALEQGPGRIEKVRLLAESDHGLLMSTSVAEEVARNLANSGLIILKKRGEVVTYSLTEQGATELGKIRTSEEQGAFALPVLRYKADPPRNVRV